MEDVQMSVISRQTDGEPIGYLVRGIKSGESTYWPNHSNGIVSVEELLAGVGDGKFIETILVNGTRFSPDGNGEVDLTGLVGSVTINGSRKWPDSSGNVNLGTIEGGGGGGGDIVISLNGEIFAPT